MTQVTNALYDSRITSESAPLTRETDIDNEFPAVSYNDSLRVRNTTDEGNTVYLSYIELANNEITTRAIKVADGLVGTVADIDTAIDAADTLIAAMSDPPTSLEYRELIDALRVPGLNPIKGV